MDQNLRSELRRTLTRNPKLAPVMAHVLLAHLESLPEGASLALYGCGTLAQALVEACPGPLSRLKTRFLVSSSHGETDFHGYPVVEPVALKQDPADQVILLSATFAHEMLACLDHVPRERVLELGRVVDAYGLTRLLDEVLAEITQHVAAEATLLQQQLPHDKPLLIFFTQQAPQHMVKTMREARRLGYAVLVVVERAALTSSLSLREYQGHGIFHALYESRYIASLEFLQLERVLRPALTHAEAGMWSAEPLAYVMEHRIRPMAVEYRDFMQTVFPSEAEAMAAMRLTPEDLRRELAAQCAVWNGADGVIMKDAPEVVDFMERLNGSRPARVLRFYHYFSRDMAAAEEHGPEKLSAATGEPHIVYAGGVVNDPNWHNYPIFRSLLEAGRILGDQGIHLTIYNAGDSSGTGYEEYLRLDEESPFFHYRFAVPYVELKAVLPRHDFGWFCFDFSGARETPFFLRTTMGSKVFTYLEAGLPVLVSPQQAFIARVITEELGVGLCVDFTELCGLRRRLAGVDMQRLRAAIKHARARWTYERHAHRLGAFYESLGQASSQGTSS